MTTTHVTHPDPSYPQAFTMLGRDAAGAAQNNEVMVDTNGCVQVSMQIAGQSGWKIINLTSLNATPQNIKTTGWGKLGGMTLVNPDQTSTVYLLVYDRPAASVTPGVTVPVWQRQVAAGATYDPYWGDPGVMIGTTSSTGISVLACNNPASISNPAVAPNVSFLYV